MTSDIGANDNTRVVDRPCDRCGKPFHSGSYLIDGGRVISILCDGCYSPFEERSER